MTKNQFKSLVPAQFHRNIHEPITNGLYKDLALYALKGIKYYSLKFQIEFDFRDDKQFYGLYNFKNYKETQVTNAFNIAVTLPIVGQLVLEKYKINLDYPNNCFVSFLLK